MSKEIEFPTFPTAADSPEMKKEIADVSNAIVDHLEEALPSMAARASAEANKLLQEKAFLPETVAAELMRLPTNQPKPTNYNEEMAAKILTLRAYGWSVKRIELCEWAPHRMTIWEWTKRYPAFAQAFEDLFQSFLEAEAEETLLISDGTGGVKRDQLRVETRLSVAGRRMPLKWGERGTPTSATIIINSAIFEKKTDVQKPPEAPAVPVEHEEKK